MNSNLHFIGGNKPKPEMYVMRLTMFLLLTFMTSGPVQGKRPAPEPVPPVLYKGVTYAAVPWGVLVGSSQNGGHLQATDQKTDRILWTLQVYETHRISSVEADVQDVFITRLTLEKERNVIVVENEKNEIYEVDVTTRKVVKQRQ